MEELFFKHIKNDDLEKAMNVYENNHVDVMFGGQLCDKTSATDKKVRINKMVDNFG